MTRACGSTAFHMHFSVGSSWQEGEFDGGGKGQEEKEKESCGEWHGSSDDRQSVLSRSIIQSTWSYRSVSGTKARRTPE
jgi:hypothetical protein